MDNRNTGKLIASLRKKLGMTQQELGDKVGVGFRAVSKWERGLNLPDISNMNELSKILGITLDELLSGKLKDQEPQQETKKKVSPKIKIAILIITTIIAITTSILIYFNNKTYIYNIASTNRDEYTLKGQVVFKGNKISIVVNDLYFKNKEFLTTKIIDYEYVVNSNNVMLFGYGQNSKGNFLGVESTIAKICENFSINFSDDTKISKQKMLKSGIVITMNFTTTNNTQITKNIELILSSNDKLETKKA